MITEKRTRKDYKGSPSTLCRGCGHDSITNHIVSALFKSEVNPYQLVKLSGIGCSSKTPAYFSQFSHGFNSLHGRMSSIATGVKVGQRKNLVLGVSGDGDSASIGLGGLAHLLRRNVPMVYLVENNGVYGLTKGQFSATSEKDVVKKGEPHLFEHIDLCSFAIEMGAGFVARSFSGDGTQLVSLLQAAFEYKGVSFIDVISPCVAFGNEDQFTKSYEFMKNNQKSLQELGFILEKDSVSVDYKEGEVLSIPFHKGQLNLEKRSSESYELNDSIEAMRALQKSRKKGHVLTGLLFFQDDKSHFLDQLNLADSNLSAMTEKDLKPSAKSLQTILNDFK